MKYNTIEESIFSSITLLFSVEEIRSFFCSLTKAHNSKLLQELTKCANLEQTILQCAQALRQNKHYFWLPHLHTSIISKLEGKDKEQYVHLFKIAICEEEKKNIHATYSKLSIHSNKPITTFIDAWKYTYPNGVSSLSELVLCFYKRGYSNPKGIAYHQEVTCPRTIQIMNKVYTVVGCIAFENHCFKGGTNITITYGRKSDQITKWKNREKSEISDTEFDYYIRNAHALLLQFVENIPISVEDNLFSSITLLFSIEKVRNFFYYLPGNLSSDLLQELRKCATMQQTTSQVAQALKESKDSTLFIDLSITIDKSLLGTHRNEYQALFKVSLSEISAKTKLQRSSISQEDRTKKRCQLHISIDIVDSSNQPLNTFTDAWNYTFSKDRNPVTTVSQLSEFLVIHFKRDYFKSEIQTHDHPVKCERTMTIEGKLYKVIGILAYERHKLHKENNITITYCSSSGDITKWKNRNRIQIKGEEFDYYIQNAHVIVFQAQDQRLDHKVNI